MRITATSSRIAGLLVVSILLASIIFVCALPARAASRQPAPSDTETTANGSPNRSTATAIPNVSAPLEAYDKTVLDAGQALTEYNKAIATLAQHESVLDYALKRVADFFTGVTTWLFIFGIALAYYYKKQIEEESGRIVDTWQSLRVGPVEIVRAAIREIKTEFDEWNLSLQSGGSKWVGVTNLASLGTYPTEKIQTTLVDPFFDLDWQAAAPRLRVLEALIAVQEDRLRASSHFQETNPPQEFDKEKAEIVYPLYSSRESLWFCAVARSRRT